MRKKPPPLSPSDTRKSVQSLKLLYKSRFLLLLYLTGAQSQVSVDSISGPFFKGVYGAGCGALSRRSTNFASSSSSPAKPSMSAAKRRLLICSNWLANCSGMDKSPVHQVWPKPSCKAQWKWEEDKADRGRGGKTTLANGQAGLRQVPEGSGLLVS